MTSTRGIHFFILIAAAFLLLQCGRVSEQEIALKTCLSENSAVGEDFLSSLGDVEDYLLREQILASVSRDDYKYLLRELNSGHIVLRDQDLAPEIRDYWQLQNPASFAAYPVCIRELTETYSREQVHSAHLMADIYSGDPQQIIGDEVDTIHLADSIRDDDFESLLYRGALLVFVLQMTE